MKNLKELIKCLRPRTALEELCFILSHGISQDEFRDTANGFMPEELGSAVDVNDDEKWYVPVLV